MPYNPGASYQGGQYLAQGKQNLIQAVMMLAGGLTEQAKQTKEYRTLLSDIDPTNADRYKKMGLSDLQATYQAKEYQTKANAANLLAQEAQGRIAQMQQTQLGQQQLGDFFRAWSQGAQGQPLPNVPPGWQTGMPLDNFQPGGMQATPGPAQSPLQSMLAAAGQYPQGAQAAEVYRALPAMIRQEQLARQPRDLGTTPYSFGTGENQLSGIIFNATGREVEDPMTRKRIADAERAGAAPKYRPPPPGTPTQVKDSSGRDIPGLFDFYDPKTKKTERWSNPRATREQLWNLPGVDPGNRSATGPVAQNYDSPEAVGAAYRAGKFGTDAGAYERASQYLLQRFPNSFGVTQSPQEEEQPTEDELLLDQ